jgi:hypothetical protein
MPYISFEQITCPSNMRTVAHLTVPATATHVEIQAEAQNVRYTMDGTVPTATLGMLFVANAVPKTFLIDDLRTIRFIRVANGAVLNFHYFRGGSV